MLPFPKSNDAPIRGSARVCGMRLEWSLIPASSGWIHGTVKLGCIGGLAGVPPNITLRDWLRDFIANVRRSKAN